MAVAVARTATNVKWGRRSKAAIVANPIMVWNIPLVAVRRTEIDPMYASVALSAELFKKSRVLS